MRYFQYLVIGLIFLVGGCKQGAANLSKYDPKLGTPSAMLIAKVEDADYINIKRVQDTVDGELDDEFSIKQPPRSPIPYKYTQSIYTIEPGTYYISYAFYSNYNNPNARLRYTKNDGLDCQQQPVYGKFTIEPDQVLYLGDIQVNWIAKDPHNMFCKIDNLATVKRDLRKAGYKELSEKIQFAAWSN